MRQQRNNLSDLLIAAGIGAACMYLLDPAYGRRRRGLLRGRAIRLLHAVENCSGVVARDLTNRTWGMGASLTRVFRHRSVEDPVLEPRIRSEMGRWVSHPHAIHVDAREGRIVLSGDILASEEDDFIRHVERLSGVRSVENRLKPHENAEKFPALQGGAKREPRFELLQTNWAPAPRLLVGMAGAAMIGSGIRSRSSAGLSATVAGALLVIRAATNTELRRLIGIRESVHKPETEQIRAESPLLPTTPESREYRIH